MAIRNVVTRGYGSGATIPFVVTRGYTLGVPPASAAISGGPFSEAQIVAGGQIITITLTNDTWVSAGFDAQRQNILNGLTSAQSEATGWNAEVRDKEVVTAVVRTSDTLVTITLSAATGYDITLDETITVTVPATAITGTVALVGTPTVRVTVISLVPQVHRLVFDSVSRDMAFSAVQRRFKLESASRALVMTDAPFADAFILLEDGGKLLNEDGFGQLKEGE